MADEQESSEEVVPQEGDDTGVSVQNPGDVSGDTPAPSDDQAVTGDDQNTQTEAGDQSTPEQSQDPIATPIETPPPPSDDAAAAAPSSADASAATAGQDDPSVSADPSAPATGDVEQAVPVDDAQSQENAEAAVPPETSVPADSADTSVPMDTNQGEVSAAQDAQDIPQSTDATAVVGDSPQPDQQPAPDVASPEPPLPTAPAVAEDPVNKVGDELPVGAADPIAQPITRGLHEGTSGLQTTNLGVLLLEATYKPSASTILMPPNAGSTKFPDGAQHLQTVVSEAPQNQKQAAVWVGAINAAKDSTSALTVNGVELKQPHFVSMSGGNQVVEAPLTTALVGANPDQSQVDATVRDAPAMLQQQRKKLNDAAPTDATTSSIQPPPTLLKDGITSDPDSLTPHGFVLGGTINLFGLVAAQLYTFHGTASDGMTDMAIITGGSATEPGTISVGSIVPSLKGTAADDIQFRKTHLSYYETPSPIDKRLGLYLEADVLLEGSLKALADDIDHFFGVQDPTIHISSHLGLLRRWTDLLNPPYFDLKVAFLNLHKKFGEMIEFTSVEVGALVRNPKHRVGAASTSSATWGWSFTGKLKLTVPGSIVPLLLTFYISGEGKEFQIMMMMTQGSWDNAFGITGLSISNARFTGRYDRENGSTDIAFDVAAVMTFGGFTLDLSGFYHGKEAWGFVASLGDYQWSSVILLYKNLFDQDIEDFDHHEDISVSNLTLSFSSVGREFTISGAFKIHDYSSVEAKIVLSQTGISVTATLDNVKFDDVEVEEASLDLFIGKAGSSTKQGAGTAVRLSINGKVKFLDDLEVTAGVFFDKEPTSKELQWAIYGMLEEGHSIGSLSSSVKGGELDMPLSNVAFIASNTDVTPASFPNSFGYPVAKGVQVCASLGSVEMIDKALHAKSSNLTLRALISKEELEFEIILDSKTMNLSFAPNVKSGALKLGIDIPKGASPSLFVEADFAVAVGKVPKPLAFMLRLDISATQAKGTAVMASDWVNPLGISEQLTIGEVALEVGIIYANAIYPNELGFGGKVMIGEVGGKVAIEITDDPAEGLCIIELIESEKEKLDIINMVKFARMVCETDAIPEPSTDFLIFDEFKLDVSTGVMFAGNFYPAGVLFKSTLELFGKKMSVDCEISKSPASIIAKGSIDPFTLGPLTVKASKFNTDASKPGPNLDFQFGSDRQYISLDGEVQLAGVADVAISLLAELHPDLKFNLDAELDFLEHLKFTLHAAATGDFKDMQDLSKLDFVVEAHFEQDILKTLVAQVNTMLLAAKHAVDETADEANATLTKAEEAFVAEIDKAQKDLDAKKADWDKKNAEAQADAAKKQADIVAESQRLQKSVDDAKKSFDDFISGLEAQLTSVEQHMNNAIGAAEKDLTDAQTDWDGKVDGAQQKLSEAQAALTRDFGDADQALSNAEASLQSAQDSANSLNDDLDRERQAYDEAGFFAKVGKAAVVAGLEVEQGVREAAVGVAEGVVEAARAIVDGPLYHAAQGLVSDAQTGLQSIRDASDTALQGLRNGCEAVRNREKPLFDAAKDALETAKNSCDQLGVWNVAKKALGDFESIKGMMLNMADKVLIAVESCAEKLAYDAAVIALSVAKANTHDLDLAKHAVSLVQEGADGLLRMGQYMVQKAGNFIDVESMDLSGSLRGLVDDGDGGQPLDAKLKGVFMGKTLDLELKYKPGTATDFVKAIYEECWKEIKVL